MTGTTYVVAAGLGDSQLVHTIEHGDNSAVHYPAVLLVVFNAPFDRLTTLHIQVTTHNYFPVLVCNKGEFESRPRPQTTRS